MRTVIELGRDGSRTVFHRNGSRAWTHPEDDPHMMDIRGKTVNSASPGRMPCPGCDATSAPKRGRPRRTRDQDLEAVEEESSPAVTEVHREVRPLDRARKQRAYHALDPRCRNGHPKTMAGLCRECRRLRQARYRAV